MRTALLVAEEESKKSINWSTNCKTDSKISSKEMAMRGRMWRIDESKGMCGMSAESFYKKY